MNSRMILLLVLTGLCGAARSSSASDLELVRNVPKQPLVASVNRLIESLEFAGSPLSEEDQERLETACKIEDDAESVEQVQNILDTHCLAMVHINPESRVKATEGPVTKELAQQGWRTFLVKVHNEAGITPELEVESPQAAPVYQRGRGARQRPMTENDLVTPAEVENRFLDVAVYTKRPLKPRLSGLNLEYRVLQLYCRDAGHLEAQLSFHVGQGTQDLGFRSQIDVLFLSQPAVQVNLAIKDFDGQGTMAGLIVRDQAGRVYPNPARRLAPDFFFHPQVYREDGETILLPPGDYDVEITRGPEYQAESKSLHVPTGVKEQDFSVQLERWIHPASRGWYSGDHHVHAAGCAHYDSPTEGVGPADMMRHILGEDLNVGCVLSWGPCWYTQKQYFEGQTSELSTRENLMRYDVEVSGFPSSHAGHLCLLQLKEDDYPGTKTLEDWPSWTLPVLKWGQQQGGVVGYSHSGWGLSLPDYGPNGNRVELKRPWGGAPDDWQHREADTLPDYAMPPFDGIGANEYIVTVTHDACDFISAVDTPAIWELNIWYHTLNCGYRARISGETDFPCIYGERVGLGRVYVKLDDEEELSFENWIEGVKAGRSYCGDGRSHLLDFTVNDTEVGTSNQQGQVSQVNLKQPGKVRVTCDASALLKKEPQEEIRQRRLDEKPYWHIERCRIDETRKVPVELIVNGQAVARKEILADGHLEKMEFDVKLEHSSWIALRILPSAHTNPVFVEIDGQPIRASRKSAEWCREAVDVCWESKKGQIRKTERKQAAAAYDHARTAYDQITKEAVAD